MQQRYACSSHYSFGVVTALLTLEGSPLSQVNGIMPSYSGAVDETSDKKSKRLVNGPCHPLQDSIHVACLESSNWMMIWSTISWCPSCCGCSMSGRHI